MTNGDEIVLIKLEQQPQPRYGLSRVFAPSVASQELHSVLQVLKRPGQTVTA